jgi:HK97 family phage portal protein
MFLVQAAAPAASDDYWYGPVGLQTSAGVAVTPTKSLQLSVVYACVRVLAESVAKLPVRVMKGEFDVLADHPVARLLRRRPNPRQTSFEWREMLQAHLSLRSNAYARVVYGRAGEVAMLVPLHPDRVTVEQTGDWSWRWRYRDSQGRESILVQDEVLHLKQLPLDGMQGLSGVETQRESIGAALAAQQYQGRFFRNGARHSGLALKYPGKFADGGREKAMSSLRRMMSGENAYSTPVLDQGMELQQLGMTNVDAQLIDARKYSDADLCRMFGVPPHMVGILDRATNNNIEHQGREFYDVTLMALVRRWEEALEVALLSEEEQDAGLRIEFDVDELLRADTTARGKFYHDAILDGWMTRNEARRRERMGPLDGLNKPLEPMNTRGAGEANPGSGSGSGGPSRQRSLEAAAADRCVTREVNAVRRVMARHVAGASPLERLADFYGAHADWMRRVLAVDEAFAARLCEARFDELRASKDVEDTLDSWEQGGGALLLSRGTE